MKDGLKCAIYGLLSLGLAIRMSMLFQAGNYLVGTMQILASFVLLNGSIKHAMNYALVAREGRSSSNLWHALLDEPLNIIGLCNALSLIITIVALFSIDGNKAGWWAFGAWSAVCLAESFFVSFAQWYDEAVG